MEELFIKSALPAQPAAVLADSSLALPAAADPSGRSLRVQQQVQLTLARKARRTPTHGGVTLQRSFEAADGRTPNMKVDGLSAARRSLSSGYLRRPSRRVEVSPPPSPPLPRARFNYSTYRQGTHTVPGPAHAAAQPRPPRSDPFQRYAFSEAPQWSRVSPSTPACGGGGARQQRSFRQAAGSQSVFTSAAFQPRGEYGARMSHKRSYSGHNGATLLGSAPLGAAPLGSAPLGSVALGFAPLGSAPLGAAPPDDEDDGLAWLARVRAGRRSLQPRSYPPSATSMEVDTGGRTAPDDGPAQLIRTQDVTPLKSENKPPEMTLERAVSQLAQDDEDTLVGAATFIQNQCFVRADAKKMVYYLRGIAKLLRLLDNDSEEVQRAAAGALRNVVYQSSENKMEVKDNDGVGAILQALGASHDAETRRQLTGVLWNLSSHDVLKERLSRQTLSVLTRCILIPTSGIYEGDNPKHELLADAEAFHNATGCLRNLSSAGPDVRRAMRECENLIDSLVYYVRGTVANRDTDDKATENCACILHNLSYQMEAELPQHHALSLRESRQNLAPRPKTVGCFSYRGAQISERLERQRPLLEEKSNPSGVEWLWSAITVRMYLSLVACSTRHCTQEAAIGALQNITAGNRAVTEAIAHTVVLRENGLQHIKKVLEEGPGDVKRSAVSLIRNLSRYQDLLPEIATQVLPEVARMLPADAGASEQPGEVTASLLQILVNLSQTDAKHVKAVVNQGALPRIMHAANTDNGRVGHAAAVLLHAMWKHSDLHGALKRNGFKKSDFINARTTKMMNARRD